MKTTLLVKQKPFSPHDTNGLALIPQKASFYRRNIAPYVKYRQLMILLLPVLVFLVVFNYVPMYGVIIAFKNYKVRMGILASPWVGLKNFMLIFSGRSFYQVFGNTLILSALKLLFVFPAPIVFALLLNETRRLRARKVIQTISYLPHFLSWVVLAGIFMQFLSPSMGPINVLLAKLGLRPVFFLGDARVFRLTLISTEIWKGIGWSSIIYLAAISGVNPELYEAAIIDGANRFRQIRHITIPGIMPVIMILFILAVGRLLSDNFDQIFNLYNPAVYSTGDVLSTYMYRLGLVQMQYSVATAVGLFRNVLGLLLIIITNIVTKKFTEYGVW